MSAFQIMISPTKKSAGSKVEKVDDIISRLILAPFSPTAEIKFGEVVINQNQSKKLIIFNPGGPVSVLFTNIEVEDRITMSESILQLNSRQEKYIIVTWTPIRSGYLRKVIRAQDVARKARSFEIILSGMAVNRGGQNTKKKKVQCDLSSALSQTHNEKKLHNLRRETYSVEEKENRQPVHAILPKASFKSSSPRDHSNPPVFHENSTVTGFSHNSFSLQDSVDALTKYSNFESELNVSDILTRGKTSDKLNDLFIRRSTLENIVMTPRHNCSFDSLENALSINTSSRNMTFDMKSCTDDVFLTPAKTLSIDSLIFTPKQPSFESLELAKLSHAACHLEDSYLSKFTFKTSSKDDVMFISPPSKFIKPSRKSPDYFMHRTGSSAIKDRRKHLRTSIIARKKSPKKLNVGRGMYSFCENFVDKLRSQNPLVLKQIVTSQCHIEDPFVKQLVYNDDHWIDEQEKEIIKWMNSVLAPPLDICEENHDWTVDGAEAWLKRNHSVDNTWTINKVPITFYNAPEKLDILRRRRDALFQSDFVNAVFSELSMLVNRNTIYVRDGRDIYADECVKNKLLQLLGSYNPVWLRMGLEAVYKREIPLHGKADYGGLGIFIRKNVIVSNSFMRKTEKEKDVARKNILLKFFQLIFFMDRARINQLIRHNRCLFSISSKYKSSQELLNAFCADLVTGKGYVMKHLKNINYILQFKQTCIDEYDYTIRTLKDLNDGVRLSRLFEILFGERDICSRLRVPAVDIENKKYNIEIAFRVAKSRCTIEGNITAEDFVLATRLGSRIKILSFLWQIINNYLTPFYGKAAVKIQRWWRKCLLREGSHLQVIRRRQNSAQIIQRAWRCYCCRKLYKQNITELRTLSSAASLIQTVFRARLAMKKAQQRYLQTIQAVIYIQSWFRSRSARKRFLELKCSAIKIQRLYRANQQMKINRKTFLKLKTSTICIQRFYRVNKVMIAEKHRYHSLKDAVLIIQRRYRSLKLMNTQKKEFLEMKKSAIVIQRQYRAMKLMKTMLERYKILRKAVVTVQTIFRAKQMMISDKQKYLMLKKYVFCLQTKFRATLLMKQQRLLYTDLKNAVLICQRRYRARIIMKTERRSFLKLKQTAVVLQNRFRSIKIAKVVRNYYLNLQKVVMTVQRRFRAQKMMKVQQNVYLKSKKAAVTIQRYFRNYKLMHKHRNEYQKLKQNTILIQKRFRARLLMRTYRKNYLQMSQSVVKIQRWFRSMKNMEAEKNNYLSLKRCIVTIQRHFRAKVAVEIQRKNYENLKLATVKIQSRFRAILAMKSDRKRYLDLRKAALVIQGRYRAKMIMREHKEKYLNLKNATLKIQKFYRGWQLMKRERQSYMELKLAVVKIKREYRNLRLMKKTKSWYLKLKESVIFVQRVWRMKIIRNKFLQSRQAAIRIQKWWRYQLTAKLKAEPPFSLEELAAVKIQALWRGYIYRKKNRRRMSVRKDVKENPESTLGERYMKAIRQLKTEDRYNVITIALWELETVTTFSAKLCEGVAAEGIVSIIFDIMARGNRSEPSLELYRACISILINLTLYEPTKKIVWDNMDKIQDLLKLIQIMQMTHDKLSRDKFNRNTDTVLFRYSVTFLWLLCQDSDIAMTIAEVPTVRESIRRIKETLKRRCPCTKTGNRKRLIRTLPKTVTNWYADLKTRTFDDHCYAILNLYDTLFTDRNLL